MEIKHEDLMYRGSYANLGELGLEKVVYIERDILHFIKFGVTADRATYLRNLIHEFMNLEADESQMVNQLTISIEKDEVKTKLRVAIRQVITAVETSFVDKDKLLVNYFKIDNLSQINEAELLKQCSRLIAMIQKYSNKLTEYTVPQELITKIGDLWTQLSNLCNQHDIAKAERKNSTIERHRISNELYRLISKYCKIGRAIWMNENQVYYQNYIITNDVVSNSDDDTGNIVG